MLTPQATPTAYIAVFFQGLLGEALFWNRKYFRVACLVLALLALLESALQRILVLTLVYGNDIWSVINKFIQKLTGAEAVTNYSYWIIAAYFLLHFITALLVGWWIGLLPEKLSGLSNEMKKYLIEPEERDRIPVTKSKRKRKSRWLLIFIFVALLLLYVQSFFKIGNPIIPENQILRIIIRSVLIILTWYFLISPVIKKWLHQWLRKKKQQSALQVQQVVNLLPAMQNMIVKSWAFASEKKGLKRMFLFFRILLANTFNRTQPSA